MSGKKREGFFTRETLDKLGLKRLSLLGVFLLVLLAVIFIVVKPSPSVFAAGSVGFSLSSNSTAITTGDTIAVQVNAIGATDLYATDITVSFNGSLLNFVRFQESTFLNSSGAVPTYVPNTYTVNSNNVSNMVITRVGNVSGASGNGTVLVMYFTGISSGVANLALSEVIASDSTNDSISITSLTNESVTVSPGGGDVIPPVMTLDSPADNFNTTSQSVLFSVTPWDNVALSNVSLYGDWFGSWSSLQTNSSPLNNTQTSFSTSNIPEGNYLWNAYACDSSNNCAFANLEGALPNRTLKVDLTSPSVTINSPTNTTLTSTNVTVDLSYTDNLGFGTCRYNVTDLLGNVVIADNPVSCQTNFVEYQTLPDGDSYRLNAHANDSAGNNDSTSMVFTVSAIASLDAPNISAEQVSGNLSVRVMAECPFSSWCQIRRVEPGADVMIKDNAVSGTWYYDNNVSEGITYTYNARYFINSTESPGANASVLVQSISSPGAPELNFTASSLSITSGQSTTLNWTSINATNCTASGSWTGAKNTTGTQLVSPTSTATYTLTCENTNGNTTKSTIITVAAAPTTPSGGGGGGGGGGSSTTVTTNTSENPTIGETHTTSATDWKILYFAPDTGIKQMLIWVKQPTYSFSVTVAKFESRPAEVPVAKSGEVYKYLRITANNFGDNFANTTITLQVSKAWLAEKKLGQGNIALYKFKEDDRKWSKLDTKYVNSDNDYYYYNVEPVESLSYFAIAEKTGFLPSLSIWVILAFVGLILAVVIVWLIVRKGGSGSGENLTPPD